MTSASAPIEAGLAGVGTSSLVWFKRFMWAGIIANLAGGLLLLTCPAWALSLLHLAEPYPTVWPRHSGLVLAGMTLFYIPAAICPLGYFYNAIIAVLVRFFGITFFLIAWGPYLWFVVYDAVFAIPQAILLWRAWRADLMSKP